MGLGGQELAYLWGTVHWWKLQIQKVHEGGWWPIGSWTDELQNGIPQSR